MAHTPKAVLGERERRSKDDLSALLRQRRGTFRYLGLITDIEANLGERQVDGLDRIAFLGGPVGFGREDVRLGMQMQRAVRLVQVSDVEVAFPHLHQMGASDDELAALTCLALEEVAIVLRVP